MMHDDYDAMRSLSHSKNKFLAHHSFRFAGSTQERVEVIAQKLSFMDTSPNKLNTGKTREQIMDLRPRMKEKEMGHGTFRYTAGTSLERVHDILTKRHSSILGPKNIQHPDQLRNIRNRSVIGKNISDNEELGGNFNLKAALNSTAIKVKSKSPIRKLPNIVKANEVLSTLHDKTHFKAATSVFLNHPGTLNDQSCTATNRKVEKLLNDSHVKDNLQRILDKTTKTL